MADDGMILNFSVGETPVKPQVKYQGGKWRDRLKAQRNAKRGSDSKPSSPSSPHQQRFIPGPKPRRDDGLGDDDQERPAKRLRAEPPKPSPYQTGKLPAGSISTGKRDTTNSRSQQHHHSHNGQVISRLFTSNPTAKTVFDDPKDAKHEDDITAEPSNAPLSEEAASFHALGCSRRLAQTLSGKIKLKAPTAIQAKVIPQLIREDSDAFVQAQTGSGKTLAYLLPVLQRILSVKGRIGRESGLFAIVLAPTRELCRQIDLVLAKLLPPYLVSTTVIGGESKHSEKSRLRKGVNVLVATPGRLTDHLQNTKVLNVGTVRWLVLDEGDRLMEMGFEADLKDIVSKIRENKLQSTTKSTTKGGEDVSLEALPARRVTVLCSATMKMDVQKLGEISLEDAVHISAGDSDAGPDGDKDAGAAQNGNNNHQVTFSAPAQLKQAYYVVPAKLRLVTLIALLRSTFSRKGSVMKAIVFISCADSVDFHFDLLKKPGKDKEGKKTEAASSASSPTATTVSPAAYLDSPANPNIVLHRLHGSLPQPVRTATLAAYAACPDPCVLITTDIASRGLDVPSVELVVELDPAFSAADHVHRVGRTARAGMPGKAVLFLMPGCEEGYVDFLTGGRSSGGHGSGGGDGESSSSSDEGSEAEAEGEEGIDGNTSKAKRSGSNAESFEGVLHKGLSTHVAFPVETDAKPIPEDSRSFSQRAEALQLHVEQRMLIGDGAGGSNANSRSSGSGSSSGPGSGAGKALLESARKGFRSHVRAYATHIKDERRFFDITELHLGHTAKSFGLREAPSGVGRGGHDGKKGAMKEAAAAKRKRNGGDDGGGLFDGVASKGAGEEPSEMERRMKRKMKSVMDAAGEFNIG